MIDKINFIYISLLLAIGTQGLNYLFMKLNIYDNLSLFKQSFITTSILLPLIFLLNYGFNIYYRYYNTSIDYSTLYITFIVFSVFISFLIQYFIYGSTNINIVKTIGFIFTIFGIYLIIKS